MKMVMAAAVLVVLGVVAPASPAQADPCGAGSWLTSDGHQHVAYRNCGASTVVMRGFIGGTPGFCYIVRTDVGQELVSKNVQGRSQSWRVENC